MGLADFIAEHPKLVIVAWILVALLAAPLFARLGTVVKPTSYSLPENLESSKASEIMERIGGSSSPAVIIVQGVNLDNNETILALTAWARMYNKSFTSQGLGSKLSGFPFILASINETLYEKLFYALNASAEGVRNAYQQIQMLNATFAAGWRNFTSKLKELNESVWGVVQADKAYTSLVEGLTRLAEAAQDIAQGVIALEKGVVEAKAKLSEAASIINKTASALIMLDAKAILLFKNVSQAYASLHAALSNETLVSNVMQLLSYQWWQASRTYYYLKVSNGNYTLYVEYTNLTSIDPRFAPLPPEDALHVFQEISTLVSKGMPVDNAAMHVVLSRVAALGVKPEFAAIASRILLKFMSIEAAKLGVENLTLLYSPDPSTARESQLRVFEVVSKAADEASEYTVSHSDAITRSAIAEQLATKLGVPRDLAERIVDEAAEGRPAAKDYFTAVALAAVKMGMLNETQAEQLAALLSTLDPELKGTLLNNRTLALHAAAGVIAKYAREVPAEIIHVLAEALAEDKLDVVLPQLAWRAVEAKVATSYPEAKQLLPIVEALDPYAEARILGNKSLLVEAVVAVLERHVKSMGYDLPREALYTIVRDALAHRFTRDTAVSLALSLLEKSVEERLGAEKAKLMTKILSRYDPDARCKLCSYDAALHAILEEAKEALPEWLNESVVLKALRGEAKSVYCSIFRQQALTRAPREAQKLVETVLDVVCEEWGLSEDEVWLLIRDMLSEKIRERKEIPDWAKKLFVDYTIKIVKGEISVGDAARDLSERMLLREVAPRVLNETRGLMVSKDLDGFTIMFEPRGDTRDERVNATREAARLAQETLEDVLGKNVEVYATGMDVMVHEVREYALHDAERTSKISEIATFIVLLLILESLLAVVLPYLGIGLGIVAGGALVYLAARAGLITVSTEAQSLMITTALGLGADYAGYIVHRFREEYAKTHDARRAAAEALRKAGPAVLASALTVIIGFGSLLLGWELSFLRSLGETIPVTVAVTAVASLTLVPALLALLGGKGFFWWPRKPDVKRLLKDSKLVYALVKHHRIILSLLTIAILVAGYYYVSFHGSHDIKLMLPEDAESVKAFKLLSEEYMAGITDPIFVAMKLPGDIRVHSELQTVIHEIAERLAEIPGVGKVIEPNVTSGALISEDGRYATIQVVLSIDPYSEEGMDTVRKIHDIVHEAAEEHGLEVYVGGTPYAMIEMEDMLHRIFYNRILPVQAVLMITAFTLIFGALPASIAAFLVILGATMMGVMLGIIVFNLVFGKPIIWFLHIVTLAAVLGVGMDYNSFFLARAREECIRMTCRDPAKPLARAAGAVSKFIIGLSLVVTAAYLSLLAASNVGMKEVGFVLGVTVFIAGVMASYLFTPLVIALLGGRAWWPWGTKKRIAH